MPPYLKTHSLFSSIVHSNTFWFRGMLITFSFSSYLSVQSIHCQPLAHYLNFHLYCLKCNFRIVLRISRDNVDDITGS